MSLLLALLLASPLLQEAQPNIIVVLADDLGYGDPGCYNPASKVPTPAIDRLAAEGMRFTDAHSPSSVCTPTRYGLLTGRYAWRTGLERSVLWPWDPPLLEDERTTLPELLQAAGYHTACIGKWHLGWDWPLDEASSVGREVDGLQWPAAKRGAIGARVNWSRPIAGGPLAHGFDHYFGDDVPNFPPYTWIEDERVLTLPTVEKPQAMFGHAGPAAPGWDLGSVLPTLSQRAATWIDAQAALPEAPPFFLYLSLTAPHTPIAPSPDWRGKSEAGDYGDFVAQVDGVLGEVLAALERNGLSENTLVVFTSDNGSPQRDGTNMSGPVGAVKARYGHDPSAPWRGLKSDAWEGGHRVPFVVRWPSKVPAGTVQDHPWIHVDLYRTLADFLALPIAGAQAEDSLSQRSAWTGVADAPQARRTLVHHSGNGVFAIREGRWKLILGRNSGGFTQYKPPADAPAGQLFDLVANPSEQQNRYAERPEIVARLTARLEREREGRAQDGYAGKVFVGYQGWFRAEGDGSEMGWHHYTRAGGFAPGQCSIDLWPDLSEFGAEERFPTPFVHADGRQAELFSSYHPATVARHFRWMQEHSIDAAFVQRFGSRLRNPQHIAQWDPVLKNAQAAAQASDREWAVMYDLSGMRGEELRRVAEDWQRLRKDFALDEDPSYLRHQGRLVLAVWGIGFNDDRGYALLDCEALVDSLTRDPTGPTEAPSLMIGAPFYYRELKRDTLDDARLHRILAKADVVSGWSVGRYATPEAAASWLGAHWRDNAEWTAARGMRDLPVVFPGFSWHNLRAGKSELGQIPRLAGRFYWSQFAAASAAGVDAVYIAMFDELDEATAIMKVSNDPPVGASPFLDRENLPSDHYLWLTEMGRRLLRGEASGADFPTREASQD
jgi:arylsulfatase A-like enzyme